MFNNLALRFYSICLQWGCPGVTTKSKICLIDLKGPGSVFFYFFFIVIFLHFIYCCFIFFIHVIKLAKLIQNLIMSMTEVSYFFSSSRMHNITLTSYFMLIKIELACGIAQAIYLVYTIKFTLIQSLFYEFIIIRMKDRKKNY